MLHKIIYVQGDKRLPLTPENGIILTNIDGLTSQNITLDTTKTVNGIGVQVNTQTVEPKNISLTGVLLGDSSARRKDLLRTIIPRAVSRMEIDDLYTITVYPTQTPEIERYSRDAGFSVMLRAPFPYFAVQEEKTEVMMGVTKLFKFPCKLNSFILGQRMQLVYKFVNNPGSVACGFTAVLTADGDVVNPKIEHMDTGEYVMIKKTMHDGDTITYSYLNGRASVYYAQGDNAPENAFSALSIDSVPFELAPGDNPIKITAADGYSLLDAFITFHPVYAGVEQ